MYIFTFFVVVQFPSSFLASPIPDRAYDGNIDLCLSRRGLSGIFDYSEPASDDSLFANSDIESLPYEVSNLHQGSDLINEGLEGDLSFFSEDIVALALDTALKASNGQRKTACPADSNSLPSGFKVLGPIPANPYIPSCEPNYPITLCCRDIPVPVPMDPADLESQVLTLPNLVNSDGLVHVGDCIICDCSRGAFRKRYQLTSRFR